jgi:hypothetical protein
MKNLLNLLALLLLLSNTLFAQDKTITYKTQTESFGPVKQGKIMLIPFDDRMYFSEFDREIAASNNIDFNDIRAVFRKAIDTALYSQLLTDHSIVALLYKFHPDHETDLFKLYDITGYNYEALNLADNVKTGFKKASLHQKEEKHKGQLVTQPDDTEKYMATTVNDVETLKQIASKYGTEYFVFINQLDFRRQPGLSWDQLQSGNYSRQVKIHYSVINKEGKKVAGGACYNEINSQENNVVKIVQKGIAPTVKQIIDSVPKTGE